MQQTIFINGRFLTQQVTGVQRYAREALLALDKRLAEGREGEGLRCVVLAPSGTARPALTQMEFRCVGRFKGNLWEQISLPRVTRGRPLFSFCAAGPLFKRLQVVTIHDTSVFAAPRAFSASFRAWYKLMLRVFVRRLPLIATVSHFSKGEIARYLACDREKLRVTTEGWQHIKRRDPDAGVLGKHGIEAGRYVLAVSSITPNKNFGLIVQAVEQLHDPNFHVVIAGGFDPSVFGNARLPSMPFVRLLGYVSDAELRALFENAGVFVYPSLYEGFGIPAIEAMASGCPVIASNSASVPEVCGDAARYVSPTDASALAKEIADLMSNPDERSRLAARGRAHIEKYSWDECARLNAGIIREWLSGIERANAAEKGEGSSGNGASNGARGPQPFSSFDGTGEVHHAAER